MDNHSLKEVLSRDKESLMKTLTRFDGQMTVEDVAGIETTHASHYHTFFLQVLLEQVCSVVEPDKERRSILFKRVVDLLSESKFLNRSLVLDNLMPLRRKAAEHFFHFVKQVQSDVIPNSSGTNASLDSILREEEFSPQLQLKNKYDQDFEELETIAKGGFGVVCKVKHKLDGATYAIKKIVFRYKSDSRFLKVIREAKSIAALNHINIVSYNNAWIECLQPSDTIPEFETNSKSSDEFSSDEENSKSNHPLSQTLSPLKNRHLKKILGKFSDAESSFNSKNSEEFVCFTTSNHENSKEMLDTSEFQSLKNQSDSSSDDESKENFENYLDSYSRSSNVFDLKSLKQCLTRSSNHHWNLNSLNVKVMLCIQMEYCDCDLYQWLQSRARGEDLPFQKDVMLIFKDILQGVAHIHSKNIIHRDLKPHNIFYSKKYNVMKIGDFGLATLADCSSQDENGQVSTSFSSNLGTLPYAAPEQRDPKSTYDSKVDIYSLGIILIELLNEFPTQMEFSKAIDGILKGNFPEVMIKNYPNHIELVENLVQKNPSQRMTAREILNHSLLEDNLEKIERQWATKVVELKKLLFEKEQEIEKLKKIIEKKDELISMHNQNL
ncbi:eukaryotic translation initiation factor 2-alpha kinase 1-like [Uloborus diversus]|uniref:eukaryotic translation initiation factor 2-alpha kinase 1-like n=1 Tax=Uloborus diversus TaxID=327109 RepID=UPI0024098B23|nr:eukaryotic translation initiation factor 2-alpha kinase 1-like [Uloborus diversus]